MNEFIISLRSFNSQVWIQAWGRLLCQIGFGLISFYIPILFVNRIGFSAAAVGFAVGLSAVAEVISHFIGGALSDSPRFGRKAALSLSAGLGVLVSIILVLSNNLVMLTLASLLLGLSLGFYWTTSSAAVMDATAPEERSQSFAVMGVMEYLGVGIGILGGGVLLKFVEPMPQLLFAVCAVIFLLFFLLIQFGMDAHSSAATTSHLAAGIGTAIKDKLLLLFLVINSFYALYVALVTSTIPLYFTNFVAGADSIPGVSVTSTANLFTWCYIGVAVVMQLPIAQLFTSFRRVRVLMSSMLLWAVGFLLLWVAIASAQFVWGMVGLCVLSIASVAYKPFSVAIVSDLAPESLRGAYMAVSSQSWTIGYFFGPICGGWAMDQSATVAHGFWLIVAFSTFACIALLGLFEMLHPDANLPDANSQPSESGTSA